MQKKQALNPRREPKQARSRRMQEDILDASIRVFRSEGPLRFTTSRVADAAGISVGSLYQYFPNKHALVFALHQRSMDRVWVEVQCILDEPRTTPREKIREMARLYFAVRSDEVSDMGAALQDAEIFFADQRKRQAVNELATRWLTDLLRQAIPAASESFVDFAVRLLIIVLRSVGRSVAAEGFDHSEVLRWADACADMIADYLGVP
jgi:AcrR family transcriptional regulator